MCWPQKSSLDQLREDFKSLKFVQTDACVPGSAEYDREVGGYGRDFTEKNALEVAELTVAS